MGEPAGRDDDRAAPDPPSPERRAKRRKKKKRDGNALRKAPQAPKRFKSSYILFFMDKQRELKEELGRSATVKDVSKLSAQKWRDLPADERAYWDDKATKDKQRYMAEKEHYTGPWQVPKKRAKKDPSAPKRPMSAFLFFSQDRRRQLKKQNPDLKNTDISISLGKIWRDASEEDRRPHIEREIREREKYKVAMAEWKREHEAKLEAQRRAQEEQMKNYSAAPAEHGAPPPPLPAGAQPPPPMQGGDPSQQQQQAPPMPQGPPPYYDPNAMYQQQPPYMPPPGQNGPYSYNMSYPPQHGYAPMAMYHPYPPQPGSHGSPTNGPPVVLGPTGVPQNAPHHYGPPPPMPPHGYYPPQDYEKEAQHSPAPAPYTYPSEPDQGGYYQQHHA